MSTTREELEADLAVGAKRWASALYNAQGLCAPMRFVPLTDEMMQCILTLAEAADDWEFDDPSRNVEDKLRLLLSATSGEGPRGEDGEVEEEERRREERDEELRKRREEDAEQSDDDVLDFDPSSVDDAAAGLKATLLPQMECVFEDFGPHGCFVKTHCRSAKDTVFDVPNERLLKKWSALLEGWDQDPHLVVDHRILGDDSSSCSPDMLNPGLLRKVPAFRAQYACNSFLEAGTEAMRSTDSVDSLISFIRSTRVCRDLSRALEGTTNKQEKSLGEEPYVVIQPWRVSCLPESEFRCFVRGGEIRAVSQYFYYCFYPELVLLKAEILSTIQSAWTQEIWPVLRTSLRLPAGEGNAAVDTFIVDLSVDFAGRGMKNSPCKEPRKGHQRCHDGDDRMLEAAKSKTTRTGTVFPVYVIELNPWRASTSACLFDWVKDAELLAGIGKLHEGPGPLQPQEQQNKNIEFRIVQQPLSDPLHTMVPAYRRIADAWVSHGILPKTEKIGS
ncbi:unnamed protein product [Amoebophrya sp. A25]|nr:unnamed protein product [Amoebophrya sp. A25]|eukprot:GSA25T00025397001.1